MSMETVQVETGHLAGATLDWAVDAIESGAPLQVKQKLDGSGEWMFFTDTGMPHPMGPEQYSADWKLAGRLRDKYRVAVYDIPHGGVAASLRGDDPDSWIDESCADAGVSIGRTATEAICRAVVEARLGATVQVPAVLVDKPADETAQPQGEIPTVADGNHQPGVLLTGKDGAPRCPHCNNTLCAGTGRYDGRKCDGIPF